MKRWWPRAVDWLLALVVVATALAEVWVPFESREGSGSAAWSSLQVVIMGGALLLRRTQPLLAIAVAGGAMVGFHVAGVAYLLFNGQLVPLVLLTFAVARHGRGRDPYVGGLVVAATMLAADLTVEGLGDPSEMIFHWGVLGTAYALGTWQRVTSRPAEEAGRRATAAEVEAVERSAAAVLAERTRIARELHDVVAHAMSLMVVQSGAAGGVPGTPPEVRRALETIRHTGADALVEMRRLVTMLREPDEIASRMPQPGVAALEALVADVRDAGLPVSLEVTGTVRDLPAGLDLTAYRIIQEALTNARRHAGELTEVVVDVWFGADELHIEVRDDGAPLAGTTGSGHGLIGMRERVQLYDGRLRTGSLPGRGFSVEASLPLEPA